MNRCEYCKGEGFISNNEATGLKRRCPICHGAGKLSNKDYTALLEAYKGAYNWDAGLVTAESLRYKSTAYRWGVYHLKYSRLALAGKFDYTGPRFYKKPFTNSNKWQDAVTAVESLLSRLRSSV